MKNSLYKNFKDFFWNSFNKINNTESELTVNHLGNGYIKCLWQISTIDNLRIKLSKSNFYAIRLFDISNNRNKINSTCIMKEIQISKFQSSISFPIPVNKGMYYFELGYRKKSGEWRNLAYQDLNLGYRIRKVVQSFEDDNWFKPNNVIGKKFDSLHELAYQLSLNNPVGGSENISYKN